MVATHVLSFLFSKSLPSFFSVRDDPNLSHAASCYWTDALVIFVACGDDVALSFLTAFFANFWLMPFYSAVFGVFFVETLPVRVVESIARGGLPGVVSLLVGLLLFVLVAIVTTGPLLYLPYSYLRKGGLRRTLPEDGDPPG